MSKDNLGALLRLVTDPAATADAIKSLLDAAEKHDAAKAAAEAAKADHASSRDEIAALHARLDVRENELQSSIFQHDDHVECTAYEHKARSAALDARDAALDVERERLNQRDAEQREFDLALRRREAAADAKEKAMTQQQDFLAARNAEINQREFEVDAIERALKQKFEVLRNLAQ